MFNAKLQYNLLFFAIEQTVEIYRRSQHLAEHARQSKLIRDLDRLRYSTGLTWGDLVVCCDRHDPAFAADFEELIQCELMSEEAEAIAREEN